jgi:hypothetical protein
MHQYDTTTIGMATACLPHPFRIPFSVACIPSANTYTAKKGMVALVSEITSGSGVNSAGKKSFGVAIKILPMTELNTMAPAMLASKTAEDEAAADDVVWGSAAADDRMTRPLAVLASEGTSAGAMDEVATGDAAADKAQGGGHAGMVGGRQHSGGQHCGHARGICQVCCCTSASVAAYVLRGTACLATVRRHRIVRVKVAGQAQKLQRVAGANTHKQNINFISFIHR